MIMINAFDCTIITALATLMNRLPSSILPNYSSPNYMLYNRHLIILVLELLDINVSLIWGVMPKINSVEGLYLVYCLAIVQIIRVTNAFIKILAWWIHLDMSFLMKFFPNMLLLSHHEALVFILPSLHFMFWTTFFILLHQTSLPHHLQQYLL